MSFVRLRGFRAVSSKKRYRAIGKPLPRVEAADKVTGRTRYAADMSLPGMLYAKVLRCPHPHARIVSVDASMAEELPGVHAVLTGRDVEGVYIGKNVRDMPVLAWERARYVGEPVAAVAAETLDVAQEALGLIDVKYAELSAVTDPIEAMRPGSPRVHDDPSRYKNAVPLTEGFINLQSLKVWEHGELDRAFANAERVFEHTFRTQLTHHGYLEPHACVVSIVPQGKIEIWASNKGPFALRDGLAQDLGIEPERIKVQVMAVGGDFGGKASLIDVPICYFLAKRAGRPVKLVLTYTEELMASSHRHPSVTTLRTGVKRDGTLCAMDVKVVLSGGAYAAFKWAPGGTVMGPRQAAGSYRVPAIRVENYCVYTNHVPSTQVRAPGCPQTIFAVESHFDIIARELGLDPVEFRLRNLLEDGEPNPLGQRWEDIRAKETLRRAVAASGWGRPKLSRYYGRGVAMYERGVASGKSSAKITLGPAGSLTVFTGVPDVGPGTHTVIQQIVAEALGVPVSEVAVKVGDTDTVPYDSGVGGSKATYTAGYAAYRAACEVRDKLAAALARRWKCNPEEVSHRDGSFIGPKRLKASFRDASQLVVEESGGSFSHVVVLEPSGQPSVTSFSAQVAEVVVDPETGAVKLRKLTTAHDAGTVLNRITYQGQIDGGVIHGVGFALMEETPLVEGRIVATNLGDFKIPTIKDVPDLTSLILESATGPLPYQGKAIGENANVPTAVAIANAVADATGVRLFKLPITAEELCRALRKEADESRDRD